MVTSESGQNQTRKLNQDPERLRRRRVSAGLDQKSLATQANVATSHVCRIEQGSASASPRVLGRLAAALGCEIADLMPPETQGGSGDEVSEISPFRETCERPAERRAS